jgi:coiled-coil domain-containing protein 55
LCFLSVYKFHSLRLQQEYEKGVQKKQTKFEMQRALEQDPTVYQYDEIYDKMEQKKIETKAIQKDPEKKVQIIYTACVLKV